MSSPLFLTEGYHIDHFGNMIFISFVDFRKPRDRTPIATLIKACRQEHAIETMGKVRISKPPVFQKYGEALIRDPSEAFASREQLIAETIDDPAALAQANDRDSAANRAAELSGSNFTIRTTGVTQRNFRHRSLTSGRNGWIFCTSLEPSSPEEWDLWWKTLEPGYDHVSYIYSARDFARALASAVAEQLGPQGKANTESIHRFEGEPAVRTSHRLQYVFHGPVIYVEDIYDLITQTSSPSRKMLLPLFAKEPGFGDQREYRFVILAEQEPQEDTEDLIASPAILATMDDRLKSRGPVFIPQTVQIDDENQDHWHNEDAGDWGPDDDTFGISGALQDLIASSEERVRDPATSSRPRQINPDALPEDLKTLLTTYAAIDALRQKVDGGVGIRAEHPDRLPAVAGAAWYAEKTIRELCQRFPDPVRGISVSSDNYIVVEVELSHWQGVECRLAVSPTGQCAITMKKGVEQVSRFWDCTPISESALQSLEDFG